MAVIFRVFRRFALSPVGLPLGDRRLLMAVLLACLGGNPALAVPIADMPLSASVPPPISDDLAGSPAYQAQQALSTPATNSTSTPASATSSSTSVPSDCNAGPMCNPAHCQAYANGQKQAQLLGLTRNTQYYKFSVSGAYAAQCVGKLVEYVQKISDMANKVITAASSPDIATALITLAAVTILDAIVTQLLNQLNNQICAITNELTSYMNSVINNAICFPSTGISPFNFGTTNLNLKSLTCQGLAINPIGLVNSATGDANLVNANTGISMAGTALDPATSFGGTTGTALMGSSYIGLGSNGGFGTNTLAAGTGNDGTPLFRNDYTFAGGGDFEYTGTADLDATGGPGGNAVLGNGVGTSGLNIDAAITFLTANAHSSSTGWCAQYVREALEAGGLSTAGRPSYAAAYGPFLQSKGFTAVANCPAAGYAPKAGDVIVEPPYPGDSNSAGHIAMFNGTTWISDFTQIDMYGGPGYRANKSCTIYRP